MRSFRCRELPVGIARFDVADKGPNILDLDDLIEASVDHFASLITCRRDDLAREVDLDPGGLPLQICFVDDHFVDGNKGCRDLFAAFLALGKRGIKAFIYAWDEKIA